jgi:cysteine-rich repeat protein
MLLTIAVALLLGAAPFARAQCTPGPLASFGLLNPVHGNPEYYVDTSGLTLALCLDTNGLCLLELPNPAAPVSFPDNFSDENFYWAGEAHMGGPNGETFLLVLAIEQAYQNEAVVLGDEFVFARVRIRGDNLVPGGAYTFMHPYGTDMLEADALGQVRFSEDIGNPIPAAVDPGTLRFVGPTDPPARVNPYLVWDPSVPPAPPAGYVGDPNVLHTVVGSPCGTNLFKAEGPGLPAGGVQTDLFSVMGKIAVFCGNGSVEAGEGEQCDDGNTVGGDCCDATCQFEAAASPCEDGSRCTVGDSCNSTGTCVAGASVMCTAPNLCTNSSCNPSTGACVNTPVVCTDGDVCTADTCNPATGCAFANHPCPTASIVADTSVREKSASSNFGASTLLEVDGDSPKWAFLRANVSGLLGRPIAGATLRMRTASGSDAASNSGGRVHAATCAWAENLMTWNTRPPIGGPALDTKGAVTPNQMVDFNVTSAVVSDGAVCFGLDSLSSDGVDYNSREATSGKPELILQLGCACGAPAPTTTTSTAPPTTVATTSTTSTTVAAGATATVVADTRTEAKSPNSNFGSSSILSADADSEKDSFIKITASGLAGPRAATLRMTVANVSRAGSDSGGRIETVNCALWNENTTTFSNQPALAYTGVSQGPVSQGNTVDFAVTLVNGMNCFAITSASADGVDYNSREASSGQPQVLLP